MLTISGQEKCECIGRYRSFQTIDGSCVCWSGYVYFDEIDTEQTEGNSDGDCQPVVDARCELTQARDASSRMCVTADSYDCGVSCGEDDGAYDVDLGR